MRCVCCLVVLVGFPPGDIGANHGRLRHIGWEKCSHGLTSRPRETSSVWFLAELLVLFGYPAASGADLLAGTLPLRYHSESLARRIPTWRLPESGSLARGSGGGVKRVRLYRKTPAHLARQCISGVQVRSRVWKRLRDPQGSDSGLPGAKFLRVLQEAGGHDPGFCPGGNWLRPGDCTSPRLQVLA